MTSIPMRFLTRIKILVMKIQSERAQICYKSHATIEGTFCLVGYYCSIQSPGLNKTKDAFCLPEAYIEILESWNPTSRSEVSLKLNTIFSGHSTVSLCFSFSDFTFTSTHKMLSFSLCIDEKNITYLSSCYTKYVSYFTYALAYFTCT